VSCNAVQRVEVSCSELQCVVVNYRVAKTHRIPYLYRSFSAKMTNVQWLFCGK